MNADDYYGKSVFKLIFNELYNKQDHQLMIGYEMGKTLSKHGSVNRGICAIDKSNFLVKIEEKEDLNYIDYYQSRSIVSMNFWGLHAGIFEELEKRFLSFLDNCSDEINDEFFLPSFINEIILERIEKFKVIQTDEQWFGLTHNADKLLLDEFLLKKLTQKSYGKTSSHHQ